MKIQTNAFIFEQQTINLFTLKVTFVLVVVITSHTNCNLNNSYVSRRIIYD